MENQQQNKQQTSPKGSDLKKQSNEQFKDSGKDDSCGCGSDSEKGNKKETATTKRS